MSETTTEIFYKPGDVLLCISNAYKEHVVPGELVLVMAFDTPVLLTNGPAQEMMVLHRGLVKRHWHTSSEIWNNAFEVL